MTRAAVAANAAAPHLTALADFLLAAAPKRPLASQTIRAIGVAYRDAAALALADAITSPWMSWDTQNIRNVIAVDVDHAEGLERAQELADCFGLPRPTLVICPWSGRSHAIWRLATPVLTGERARAKPRALCHRAGRLLADALGGTLMPPRALPKSPWGLLKDLVGQRLRRTQTPAMPMLWHAYEAANTGLMWHTIPGEFRPLGLLEVIKALTDPDDEQTPRIAYGKADVMPKAMPEASTGGRNCSLFDAVRYWAYRHHETDPTAILIEAERVNATFCARLPAWEVRATAKSIAKFMVKHYRPTRMPRTIADRNAATAKQAGAARIVATDAKIVAAIETIKIAGELLTYAAIAKLAGVGIRTLKRRRHLVIDTNVQEGATTKCHVIRECEGGGEPRSAKAAGSSVTASITGPVI
jgi:hypothetical protein